MRQAAKADGAGQPTGPVRVGAAEFLHEVVDRDSWIPWRGPARHNGWPAAPTAQTMPGDDLALITGEARIGGHRCALIVSNFAYRGGSLGVAASEQLISALDRARTQGLPVVASTSSGGARLQEGPRALVQMLRITAALTEFRRARLPYVVYLRHPTLGATMATWAAMGHLIFAQPGALLGLVGPRATSAHGAATQEPEASAETWQRRGLVDGVVALPQLRAVLSTTFTTLYGAADDAQVSTATAVAPRRDIDAEQPAQTLGTSVLDLVSATAIPLEQGRTQVRAAAALCRLGRVPCILVTTVWTNRPQGDLCGPAELRLVRRAIRLAEDLGLPMVSLVEAAGPDASVETDLAGACQEIASCTAELLQLGTPTVSVITGLAVGGPAIAMLPADRVLCTAKAWLSPMSPQRIARVVAPGGDGISETESGAGPEGLRALGIVDGDIPTAAGATRQAQATALVSAVEQELDELMTMDTHRRVGRRTQRYLSLESL